VVFGTGRGLFGDPLITVAARILRAVGRLAIIFFRSWLKPTDTLII
jgi:hypothetical protein